MPQPQDIQPQAAFSPEPLFDPDPLKNDDNDKSMDHNVVLKKNRQGHFTGTALINGVPVSFMIDTGATETVIPVAFANQAHLPVGGIGRTHTANGIAPIVRTEIKSLTIGKPTVRNVEGNINYTLDEALIGMSTLKMFTVTMSGDTMTLTGGHSVEMAAVTGNSEETGKKWKKSVTCDSHGENCKTAYSH